MKNVCQSTDWLSATQNVQGAAGILAKLAIVQVQYQGQKRYSRILDCKPFLVSMYIFGLDRDWS